MNKLHSMMSTSRLSLITLMIAMFITGCSQSDQEKVSSLIRDYASKNIADKESFEIMQIDSIKEAYSDIYDEDDLELFRLKYDHIALIADSLSMRIDYINQYLAKNEKLLEILNRQALDASYSLLSTMSYSNNLWSLLAADDRAGDAIAERDKLKKYVNEAKTERKITQEELMKYSDSIMLILQQTCEYCESYQPKFLGNGTTVKCRYKGEDGNMKTITYDVIFDDEIKTLTSVKVTPSENDEEKNNLTLFVNYAKEYVANH